MKFFVEVISLSALVFLLFVYNPENNSSQEVLRNGSGAIIGYIDSGSGKRAVRNKGKKIVGYIDSYNTYDDSKKKIARNKLPGLLLCGEI